MFPPVLWRVVALWRVGLGLAGLLFPPMLGLIGVIRGWKKQPVADRKRISPVALGMATLANWAVLLYFMLTEKLGVGLDYHPSRLAPALLGLSLLSLLVSSGAYASRRTLLVANFLLVFMWFDTGYAPGHWLDREDFGSVTVNGEPVPATVYVGNPRFSEAEAIALVHVPSIGNYFFDFSSETFRGFALGSERPARRSRGWNKP